MADDRGWTAGNWYSGFSVACLLMAWGAVGCAPSRAPLPAAAVDASVGVSLLGSRRCVRPEEGCSCESMQSQPCFLPSEVVDGQAMCFEGTRSCEGGEWTACIAVSSYAAPSRTPNHQALLDTDRDAPVDGGIDVPNCDVCDALCFKAVDDLDPTDGPLDGTNSSGGVLYATPMGITLVAGEFGLPPGTSPPVVSGNNTPIVATLLPGDSVTTVIDALALSMNKLDVYFLIELDSTMTEELVALATELSGATDYVGASTCVDLDGDGSPDSHGSGLIEAVRCVAKDPWFGLGYFREVPLSPHAAAGQVAYEHVQDMSQDGALSRAALTGLAVEDLSGFADVSTSQVVALEALATRDGYDMGPGNTQLAAQTACPSGSRGYPCFRDDAVALVVVLTDRSLHNGPGGNDYAATFEVPADPDSMDDLSVQGALGTLDDLLDLGDITSGWNQFVGTTDDAVSSSIPGSVVRCDSADASGDAVHEFTISGLAAAATVPVTLSTYGSSFDTVVSLHDAVPTWLGTVSVPIANNNDTDTEADGYALPSAGTDVNGLDISTSGASTLGLGSEVSSSLMGCLGNDNSAPDAVYTFDVGAGGADLIIDTAGSSFDTVISLFKDNVEPVSTSWSGWVDYDEFFTEGWDDWNRNGDGVLCNGGACDQDWTCDSGSPDKWCGFYMTGSDPEVDDVDCLGGSTCVFVVDAPGQDVLLDRVDVRNGSTFFLKVIAANTVEIDGMKCSEDSRCGFDFGSVPSVNNTDITCENDSFCYMVHNEGELGELDTNDNATLQIDCGANSNCGKGVSDCDDSSLCAIKREPGSTVEVEMDCRSSASCICFEGDAGQNGCENFCGAGKAAVCANANGQNVLDNGGPGVPGVVQRLACDDNGAVDGVRSEISTGYLEPGTYYVVVKGKRSGEQGNYRLRIRDTSASAARLVCNDNETASVTHSEIDNQNLGNGTYYAIVKGRTASDEGDYVLTVGVEPDPFVYTPPTYAEAVAALNTEDIRVASVVTCTTGDADCATARSDSQALATASRASIDPGSGAQPLSYVGVADASDLGTQVIASIKDLTDYFAMDVTWRVVDSASDPTYDSNLFTTTISPDNAALCQGVSGSSYLGCQSGEMPSFSVTFENPLAPGNVPDNGANADGSYGFALQMVGTSPGVAGSPEYVLEEVPVFLVPNSSLDPSVPQDGTYSQTLSSRACRTGIRPDWQELYFKAYVPLGTSLDFKVCGAEEEADLAGCSLSDLVTVEAVDSCGGGCPGDSICASGLADITPNDVCIDFTSSVMCAADADCPAGLSCQGGVCVRSNGTIDIATVLPTATVGSLWTRYDIEWRADTNRILAPTLDFWHVTYTCDILD